MRFKQEDIALSPVLGSSVLIGCADTPRGAINTVRNGILVQHGQSTIGKALDGAFQNGLWNTYKTATDEIVIQFDGTIGGPALWPIGVYLEKFYRDSGQISVHAVSG